MRSARKEDVDDSPKCSKKILHYSLLNGALGKTKKARIVLLL